MSKTDTTASARRWPALALYVVASVIALFIALDFSKASLYDGEYHPVGNDAFYHARRIVDTASERGFYDFDDTIHVPEGSAVTWPWAYDYLLGKLLAAWQGFNPDGHPMALLAFVPPVLLLLNIALFVGLTGSLGLSMPLRSLAAVSYALFPFTQILHGVGAIDHHMVEHSFVLAAVWLAVLWAQQPSRSGIALGLAVTLGAAPAFHNGLFIIQLPLLLGLAVGWLRQSQPSRPSSLAFSLALPIVTLLMALPSSAIRELTFDFSVLSWFHVYISVCTAAMVLFFSRASYSMRHLGYGLVLAVALGIPILIAAGNGLAFIQGDILLLDQVEEMQSPIKSLVGEQSSSTIGLYSALIFLLPIFVIGFVVMLVRAKTNDERLFAAYAIVGLALMATQMRLQYFGSFALLLALPLLAATITRQKPALAKTGMLVATLVTALAFQKPLTAQLFSTQNLALDVDYEVGVDAFAELRDHCQAQPGIVLTSNNFGHPARYHSDCSVIANNFLLTPQHEAKILELESLWQLSPDTLQTERPDVRYVLVVLNSLYRRTPEGVQLATPTDLARTNPPLAMALTRDTLPEGFSVVYERRLEDQGQDLAIARLVAIAPNERQ
ncbi:MAG: hypothetical protein AB8F65_06745 [Woeseiaceae bacterium]